MAERFMDQVLAKLARRISESPSGALRNRCLSRRDLIRLLVRIRNELAVIGEKQTPGTEMLQRLVASGLVQPVPIDVYPTSKHTDGEVFLVDFGASVESLHPVELLLALRPSASGVICYFTALWQHALTTQIPPHHHIARLISPPVLESGSPSSGSQARAKVRARDPLGTRRCLFQGTPYYETRRSTGWVPGVQTRHLNEITIFQMTTIEQTLLDTLQHPQRCGGPAVIFEAWDTGLEILDEERLLSCLVAIDNALLERRVGYLLEWCNYEPEGELKARLVNARKVAAHCEYGRPPIFRGYHFERTDDRWLLEVP